MTTVIAPFYRWPSDIASYDAFLRLLDPGDAIILNPRSGDTQTAEGEGERDDWVTIRNMAKSYSVKALLYQATSWGSVPPSTIRSQVHRAQQWCDWDGIFFDQAPSRRNLRLIPWLLQLHGLAKSCKAAGAKSPGWSVWNAGTGIDYRLAKLPGSIWVTFEGPGDEGRIPPPQPGVALSQQAAIVYGVPSWAGMRDGVSGYGYYYATIDRGPGGNPYDGDPNT
jgi:hypothetical protein